MRWLTPQNDSRTVRMLVELNTDLPDGTYRLVPATESSPTNPGEQG